MKEEWAPDTCKSCRSIVDNLLKDKRKLEAEFMKQTAVLN